MRNGKRTSKGVSVFFQILLQAMCFYPWMDFVNKRYHAWGYLLRLLASQDLIGTVRKDYAVLPLAQLYSDGDLIGLANAFLVEAIAIAVFQVLALVQLIRTVRKNSSLVLEMVELFALCPALATALSQCNIFERAFLNGYPYWLVCLVLCEILLPRMMESYAEAKTEIKDRTQKERQWKEEKKRRLAFHGRYQTFFYRLMWKNFCVNRKDYLIFVLTGALPAGMLFLGIALAQQVSPLNKQGSILRGHGITAIILEYILVSMAVMICLVASNLQSYMRVRMNIYVTLSDMGMRKRTLYAMMYIEVISCALFTIAGGWALGNALLSFADRLLVKHLRVSLEMAEITFLPWLLTALAIAAVFGVSAMILSDFYWMRNIFRKRNRVVEKQAVSLRHGRLFGLLGAVLAAWGLFRYAQPKNAEGLISLALFLAGVWVCAKKVISLRLDRGRKRQSHYYQTLLSKNCFYYRFHTTFRYLAVAALVPVLVLFFFAKDSISTMIAQEPERLFPYDYMCMATEDDQDFFDELKERYQLEIWSYPMVRVTNVDNSPTLEKYDTVIWPQGQHIGVSYTTYRELCAQAGHPARDLKLSDDGSDVYLVFQQDKSARAHPIDYYYTRSRPYLRIGLPLSEYTYNERASLYPSRTISGEEIAVITGAYRQGNYENLVVFSDAYFEQVKDDWAKSDKQSGMLLADDPDNLYMLEPYHWATRLVLIRGGEGKQDELETELEAFQEKHTYEQQLDGEVSACYSTREQIAQIEGDRTITMVTDVFLCVMLTFVSLVVLYLRFEAQIGAERERNRFYACMGMQKRERIALLRVQTRRYLWIPLLSAVTVAPLLTGIVWRMREYTLADCVRYVRIFAVCTLIYAAAHTAGVLWIERHYIRKVEGNDAGA